MRKIIKVSGSTIEIIKNKPIATIKSVYGIGSCKAAKISSILLNNPLSKKFSSELIAMSQERKTQRVFKAVKSDNVLKLEIYSRLETKFRIGCLKARRILQNLPSRGQRTHTNAGTPSRINPFLALGIKTNQSQEMIYANKKWELNWNGRSDNLAELATTVKRKYNRAASKASKERKLNKKKKTLAKKTGKK